MTDNVRLQLHGAIYRPDSFVLMPRYCANLKAIRYESTGLNRIVADKSHHVIVALLSFHFHLLYTLSPSHFQTLCPRFQQRELMEYLFVISTRAIFKEH